MFYRETQSAASYSGLFDKYFLFNILHIFLV